MIVIALVVDSANVYWSTTYGVGVVPIGGGTPSVLEPANTEITALDYAGYPTLDGQNLYWLHTMNTNNGVSGVYRAVK